MLWAASLLLSRQPESAVDETCYILYWQDDAWVQYLRSNLPNEGPLRIELAEAADFTNDQGLIVYPVGAHSIQIRPPEALGQPWRIWYWYSGSQPSVLQPAISWFWQQTRAFFGQQLPLEVRVSPLEPINPLTESARIATREIFHRRQAKPLVLVACLFFCAAYLPALYLAEQATAPVLDTVITKPIGIGGWGRATIIFHTCLAATMTLPILFAFGWLESPGAVAALAVAFAAYLGLGFTIGCNCQGAAAASSALVLYGLLSGALLATTALLPGIAPESLSLEGSLIKLLRPPHRPLLTASLVSPVCWSLIWMLCGGVAFRRLAQA